MSDEDTDRYGRLLRYVDVGGRDAGLAQISAGLAIAPGGGVSVYYQS